MREALIRQPWNTVLDAPPLSFLFTPQVFQKFPICFSQMHLTLALLALVGYAMAGVHQIPLIKVESMRTRMIREGTWARHLEMKNAARSIHHLMLSSGAPYEQRVSSSKVLKKVGLTSTTQMSVECLVAIKAYAPGGTRTRALCFPGRTISIGGVVDSILPGNQRVHVLIPYGARVLTTTKPPSNVFYLL